MLRFTARTTIFAPLYACAIAATATAAPADDMLLVKPSTTGVPGTEMRVMSFDAEGNLWVVGRWPFWGEAALAMLSADQLPYAPLPAGGFGTGNWQVWSSVHHPIPSPYIFDIAIMPDGVIWIASEGGLTRFDRSGQTQEQKWQTYGAPNSPLIINSVRSIDADAEGNLWLVNAHVSSSSGALFKFNPGANQWTQYTVGQQLPWNPPWLNLNAVHVGASGTVYVTHSVLGGFAEFDGASWTYRSSAIQLGGILEDLQGNVWFTTSSSGLIKWNGASFQSYNLGSQGTVTALGMHPQTGLVYAGSWYGDIFRMVAGGGGGHTPQFFVNALDIPGSIHPRPDGEIWINNYGGNGILGTARQYSSTGQLLRRINTYNSGLPDYFIDSIQRDRHGNMWFACGEGGISRYAPTENTWRNFGNHNDNAEPYPWAGNEPMAAFYLDSNGTGWMGGNGIGRWNDGTGTFTGFWNWQNNPGMGVTMFPFFAEDAGGNIFAASEYGSVFRFNGTNWQNVNQIYAALGLPGMASDSKGNIWLAGWFDLEKWDGSSWRAIPLPDADYFFDLGGINCVAIGPDDVLWLGTDEGIVRYDGSSFTRYHTGNSPLPANQVQGIDVRGDGTLGLSAHEFGSVTPFPNGVAIIQGDINIAENWTIYQYGTSPLPHYQLGDVEFDADGHLWVSAISEGVVKIQVPPADVPAGDLNSDGLVNVADLLQLLSAWGACANCDICEADLNDDCTVGVDDLLIALNNWG